MHTIQIKHQQGSSVWVAGEPGTAMQIRHPDTFQASLQGAAGIEAKGRDRETALGECLLQAASEPLAGLTLPADLRDLSPKELGRIAIDGGVPGIGIVE